MFFLILFPKLLVWWKANWRQLFSVFKPSSIPLLIIKVITLSKFRSSRSIHLGLVFVNLRPQHFDTECCDEIFTKKKKTRVNVLKWTSFSVKNYCLTRLLFPYFIVCSRNHSSICSACSACYPSSCGAGVNRGKMTTKWVKLKGNGT